tara:strand:+ start:807 stop:1232 length:426 start_codon:yes stop_codon:yes gene_type:complete
MKILLFGLPGSGKSTLAEELAPLVEGIWLNADAIRKEYNDWDFSMEGRIRQANRMRHLSDGIVKAGKIVLADFVCPTEKAREAFGADFSIWMNTIKEGRFEDTNRIFEIPTNYDYVIKEWVPENAERIKEKLRQALVEKNV